MASPSPERNIIIIGGGIIGSTTAYFLTRHPSFNPLHHHITIIEAQSIASAASGKAGGLLALWAYPKCIVPLSYRLHEELAREHDGAKRWGYRTLSAGSLGAKGRVHDGTNGAPAVVKGKTWTKLPKTDTARSVASGIPGDLDWFDDETLSYYSEMGTPNTTAQVHPYQFTTAMAELAVEGGTKLILGSVTSIDYSGPEGVKAVTYEDKITKQPHTVPATDVIIAAGPWTRHVFPSAPIEAMRAHSVVIKAEASPYAIFSEIELPKDFGRKDDSSIKKRRHGTTVSPEMYARPDGTVYACGEGDTLVPLPRSSDLVICDDSSCQDILDYCGSISIPLREGEVLVKQACYLPSVIGGGGPLIGETGIRGLLMATGHTCWGIQNSCATGKVMSEFVFEGGARSADVKSLDPRRVL